MEKEGAPAKVDNPVLVKAAPRAARKTELEELKKENERIHGEKQTLMQQFEQDTANMNE